MKSLLCALALVAVSTVAFAAHSVDASDFDVAGVRLGMTEVQAVSAVTQELHVSKSQIRFVHAANLTGKKVIDFFYVDTHGARFAAYFMMDVLGGHPETSVVAHVLYNEPTTQANTDGMAKAALAKYGEPTFDGRWCVWGRNLDCEDGPVLYLHSTTLDLKNPLYRAAILKSNGEKVRT